MKKILFVLASAFLLVALSAPTVFACGDKFLVGNSAARFNGFLPAAPPSMILIYAGAGGNVEDWEQKRTGLEANGHTVVVQNDQSEMLTSISNGEFDVVMMEVSDARELREEIATSSEETIILPYINFGTRSERSTAKDEFGGVVPTPITPSKLTKIVESALAVALSD